MVSAHNDYLRVAIKDRKGYSFFHNLIIKNIGVLSSGPTPNVGTSFGELKCCCPLMGWILPLI